ncbi:MAG TPA: tRNA (adenosine(37)-N6)-threonylcarbamoyltransferase complex dimerization subunit type 1 TsaB, partial [Candidatus Saccharimonadales bacterium]|nr:tRNA (adenosine(37)-N6)-threonylcarbamoyltransferase complex dimerization subunit type 1 TsaB [Candidatus Saccharimonadales bacterium]
MRTDTAEATIVLLGTLVGPDHSPSQIDSLTWTAGRQLSATLMTKIEELLGRNQVLWQDLTGLIVFAGPGSFTGLRIGITVANTIAYSLHIPVVAVGGDDWIGTGARRLAAARPGQIALPEYGA